jgi:hypothetical protein
MNQKDWVQDPKYVELAKLKIQNSLLKSIWDNDTRFFSGVVCGISVLSTFNHLALEKYIAGGVSFLCVIVMIFANYYLRRCQGKAIERMKQ